jgi:hypothetical protein
MSATTATLKKAVYNAYTYEKTAFAKRLLLSTIPRLADITKATGPLAGVGRKLISSMKPGLANFEKSQLILQKSCKNPTKLNKYHPRHKNASSHN